MERTHLGGRVREVVPERHVAGGRVYIYYL